MTFKYLSLITLTLGLFTFVSEAAQLQEGEEQALVRNLIQPLVFSWVVDDETDLEALRAKTTEFRTKVSDERLSSIMHIAAQYVHTVKMPSAEEDGLPIPPSINEVLSLMSTLVDIEAAPYERFAGEVARFAFYALEEYTPISPLDYQTFYLKLFSDIFSQTGFNEKASNTIIDWTRCFLRVVHSEEMCTSIAHSVRQYVQNNPNTDYENSNLQVALQLEGDWEGNEVLRNLRDILGLSNASSAF